MSYYNEMYNVLRGIYHSSSQQLIIFTIIHILRSKTSHYTYSRGFQEVKVPRFHDNGTG